MVPRIRCLKVDGFFKVAEVDVATHEATYAPWVQWVKGEDDNALRQLSTEKVGANDDTVKPPYIYKSCARFVWLKNASTRKVHTNIANTRHTRKRAPTMHQHLRYHKIRHPWWVLRMALGPHADKLPIVLGPGSWSPCRWAARPPLLSMELCRQVPSSSVVEKPGAARSIRPCIMHRLLYWRFQGERKSCIRKRLFGELKL